MASGIYEIREAREYLGEPASETWWSLASLEAVGGLSRLQVGCSLGFRVLDLGFRV